MKPEIIASLIGTFATAFATIIVALIQNLSKKSEKPSELLVPEGYKVHRPQTSIIWRLVLPLAVLGGVVSYFSSSWFYNPHLPQATQIISGLPAITPSATSTIEAITSLQASETPSNYADPVQFVRDYFSLLNERWYEEAWSKLSDRFKENLANRDGGGYDEYVAFWNTVDNAEIALIEIKSQSNTEVLIYTEILYHYKDGHTETGHTTYRLVKDSAGTLWLFDPN